MQTAERPARVRGSSVSLGVSMDQGHYNCRDYYFALPNAVHQAGEPRTAFARHESWAELEQRSRSPASLKPKFPLLRLPLELRQQILGYVLPRTEELGALSMHFSAAPRCGGVKGKPSHPASTGSTEPTASPPVRKTTSTTDISNVVWCRGNVKVFRVCKQLHEECADLLYGGNTFLLFITFKGITFRFRWRLTSGLFPTRSIDFIEQIPARYAERVKKLTVYIDHIDSYTAMANFNVSGKGLTHGTRRQVQRLVNHLSPRASVPSHNIHHGLSTLKIAVLKGRLHGDFWRGSRGGPHPTHQDDELDVREMLQPLGQLRGIRSVTFGGAVPSDLARNLSETMRGDVVSSNDGSRAIDADDDGMQAVPPGVRMCVYGNDL